MDHLQISIEANDLSWRERCNFRIEGLKNAQFSSSDSPSQLLQEKLSLEKKFMSHELYQSVENNNADEFVDQLEKIVAERRLSLSDIFDQVTRAGDSVLHLAIRFGADGIAELICMHSAKLLTRENEFGDTPLHEAVYIHDNFEPVSLLLQSDNSVAHRPNMSGKSPLYIAVKASQSTRVIDLLLEATFVDNPLPKRHGISPLHAAVSERNSSLLIHILEKNVEVMYLRDEDGGTALHYAASTGYLESVRELLHRSTLIALEWDKDGHLPIHLACKMGHVKVVEEFLKQKWPNVRDMLTSQGQNILHIAVKNEQYGMVKYLLSDNRLDKSVINGKDKEGNTALHWASTRSDPEILYLISRDDRVNLNIKNSNDLTATDIAGGLNIRAFSKFPKSCLIPYSASKQNGSKSAGTSEQNGSKSDESSDEKWIDDNVSTALVVAALIVTVTFAAGFTVPGGVYSSDKPGSEFGGLAVLAHRKTFREFIIYNTAALYTSAMACLCLMSGRFAELRMPMMGRTPDQFLVLGLYMIGLALITMLLAFTAATRLIVGNEPSFANIVHWIGRACTSWAGHMYLYPLVMFIVRYVFTKIYKIS